MVHAERLRAALEYIVAHPEEWNQTNWVTRTDCGAAGCLAGVVAVKIMGAQSVLHSAGVDSTDMLEFDSIKNFDFTAGYVESEVSHVSDFARLALGLSHAQSDELFESDNTLHDLYWYANDYTNGEIEIPEDIAQQPRSACWDE